MFRIGSTNTIAKRFEAAGKSRVPGFVGVIASIDKSRMTVDLWRQGSPYVMRGVPYGVSLRTTPEWIRVRSSVYVRYPSGNRMYPEVEGPALSIPTTKAGTATLPGLPAPTDTVLSGLRVTQSATPGQRVVIETGSIRILGITTTFGPATIGENLTLKCVSGQTPGVAKFGQMGRMGASYCYLPLLTAPTDTSLGRYDNIEMNSSLKLEARAGFEATNPIPLDGRPGSIVLAYVLRRRGNNTVVDADIQTVIQNTAGVLLLTAVADRSDVSFGDTAQVTIKVTVQEYDGLPVNGHNIMAEILSGNGSLTPYTLNTDASGIASFSYTRGNTASDESPAMLFKSTTDSTLFQQVVIFLRDVNGNPV